MAGATSPLKFGAASGTADITKVFLDRRVWDKVMSGPVGHYLRNLSPGKAMGAKTALLLASAFVKWHLRKNALASTYFKDAFGDVLGDFASEILSRWEESYLESLLSILNLDQKQVNEFLDWYQKQDAATQQQAAYEWRNILAESLAGQSTE